MLCICMCTCTLSPPPASSEIKVIASFDPNWLKANKPKDTSSCSSVKTGSCPEKREPPERKAVLCIQPFFNMWQREAWGAQLWQRLAWSKPLSRHLRIQTGDTHWSTGNQALLVPPARGPCCFQKGEQSTSRKIMILVNCFCFFLLVKSQQPLQL